MVGKLGFAKLAHNTIMRVRTTAVGRVFEEDSTARGVDQRGQFNRAAHQFVGMVNFTALHGVEIGQPVTVRWLTPTDTDRPAPPCGGGVRDASHRVRTTRDAKYANLELTSARRVTQVCEHAVVK